MTKPPTFADLVSLWPSRTAFAAEIGITPGAVRTALATRGKLNHKYFHAISAALDRCGYPSMTYAEIAALPPK
jgi:hypothetical protein